MKCPRCGSELNVGLSGEEKFDFQCLVCGKSYGITNSDTFEYQQRLDNVLSKFKRVMINAESGRLTYLLQTNYELMAIGYYEVEQQFKILANIPRPLTISLNTVESLIKDMEATNEN